ncbi:MAG: hypothetical protein KDD62_14545, partial [Bdellovibrionales bacterium]|nr:hypothetical protein [Bdellovibrionales bacterium]
MGHNSLMRRYGLPLILIFSILPYLPIFWNGFVGDDVFRIVQNPEIGELSLFQLLQRPLYPGDIFRPVMIFLQAAIIKSCGMSAFPLHLLSVLLHAANGVLVLTLLRRFLKYPLALASTLVFAVHPLHSEAVANISAQSVLLMSFFCFLSLVLTLGDRCTSFTRLALLFFTSLLAFGSKESGFALFVLIPVFLSWSARTERIPKALTVLLSSASFYMLGRISALGSSDFF